MVMSYACLPFWLWLARNKIEKIFLWHSEQVKRLEQLKHLMSRDPLNSYLISLFIQRVDFGENGSVVHEARSSPS